MYYCDVITWMKGDIFTSVMPVLAAPVNAVGTMGAGLAKQFACKFAGLEQAYKKACKEGLLKVGSPWLILGSPTNILCIATKDHWKLPSEYLYIEQAVEWISRSTELSALGGIALPALGCGLGGLEWSKVRGIIEQYLGHIPLKVEVYEP